MERLIVGCVGLLLSIAAAGAWAQERAPPTKLNVVPMRVPVLGDLRGKTCDEARAELRNLHFGLEACPTGRTTGDYPAGTINAQSLKPGTPAAQLQGLRVTLEPAPARDPPSAPGATLPDLRGKTCDQARVELRRLNVALTDCRPGQSRSRYPVGTINAQSYAAGIPVSQVDGLRVTIEPGPVQAPESTAEPSSPARTDSRGAAAAAAAGVLLGEIIANAKAPVLPDLRGKTCEQAQAELRSLHIELAECLPGRAGSNYPAGTVSAQSQAPGTPASRVRNLRVRFEPQPPASQPEQPKIVLPDLRGKTCDEAAQALAGVRLKYASCAVADAVATYRPGQVNAQSPEAGTPLPLAVPIVLRVQPVPMVVVPALIGLGEAQAASALAGRGLQARPSGPAAPKGRRVLTQSPPAGTAVAPGSPVAFGLGLSVPSLLGLDCAAARTRAAEYGHTQFECEARPATSASEVLGRVFEQAPEANGAAVPAPAAIRVALWVAQPVTVPDVRERGLDEAISIIESARLVAKTGQQQGERIVAQQTPAPGTVVDAGSEVNLDTREMVEVPDVVGQTLGTAQSTLQQARLRAAADAQDHAQDRIVQAQAPAAHARVSVDGAVQLSTKRFATVPDLGGKTCEAGRTSIAPDTFSLNCIDENSWRVTVFGTPLVARQQPVAQARAEVGATIVAEAQAPLPPSLRNVPLVAVAGVVVAPFLGLGLWLAWPRVVPTPPPPPPPTFAWRVAADTSPSVSLRWPSDDKAGGRGSNHGPPKIEWRVVPDAGHVMLREFDAQTGGDHADR